MSLYALDGHLKERVKRTEYRTGYPIKLWDDHIISGWPVMKWADLFQMKRCVIYLDKRKEHFVGKEVARIEL